MESDWAIPILKITMVKEITSKNVFPTICAKNTPMSELPPSVFAGARGKGKGKRKREDAEGAAGAAGSASASAEELSAKSKDIAWIEFEVAQLCDLMNRVVEQTKIQIEKKQTRTMEELEAELEADGPQNDDSDSDDEEKAIYNPKNLPLGWDGKPIPYWLYKLHGLNIEYNCEICGNYKYYGPRAFDRHFSEWRHTHGLKCLGVGVYTITGATHARTFPSALVASRSHPSPQLCVLLCPVLF